MIRLLALLAGLSLLTACTAPTPEDPLVDLGAFHLGHNIVVAPKMQKGPVSRDATKDEWIAALTDAVGDRFGRYDGDQLYHFGISVEGFMLAPPGIPVIYTPKSVVILNITVWDDAAGKKLNDKPKQITAFETTSGNSALVGSGHERTKQEQMQGLSRNAVAAIEKWLVEMNTENGWFAPRPDSIPPAASKPTDSKTIPEANLAAPLPEAG
ncbi:hypothetical protein [Antarcticimicrobium sediminis]|uniref:hypothetical protein n=1 Tax=Antarcticimicrobium sediminis TaxID=2546227 RepID=UPI001FE158F2|nr:hypothetical protein [Antarcticimicrobium sediminis]